MTLLQIVVLALIQGIRELLRVSSDQSCVANETPAHLGSRYRIERGDLEFPQNADVRPTDTNPVIILDDGRRVASMRRWGIVPNWAKDPTAINNPFNARSEEAYAKPFFREPFRSKRCLVPATAFFEWMHLGQKRKEKYRFARADGDMVTLAGLYDHWRRGDDLIDSYTILTTAPNALMKAIHNRMPAILGPLPIAPRVMSRSPTLSAASTSSSGTSPCSSHTSETANRSKCMMRRWRPS